LLLLLPLSSFLHPSSSSSLFLNPSLIRPLLNLVCFIEIWSITWQGQAISQFG
jgi:hypothetical protein